MDFGKQCSAELEKLTGGHWRDNSLYFTLEQINQLPIIIKRLNYIDDLVISPFHITDSSVMEAYWCTLSIKTVNDVQDKYIVLLSEAGKSRLEEIEDHYIEQWDYTYYEILKDDIKGFIESLNRYVTYMERREILLREEYDIPNHNNQGIYYEIW
ncbi:hypothetical protein KW850_04000 [Bacillus sp. sid0103]|uniref:hypothetical protein n=1 Tax=Bacillus sp. sid0103 TaxID=2856337 RepID=UPI001C4924CE|nr:hypothetical protein [Bacillus sp. sid0103]MBV7504427.1 hypothetical protein [Bacillus sp. sid0103]